MNIIVFILARNFVLGSAESAGVLLYIEHFGLCRKRRNRKKESLKPDLESRDNTKCAGTILLFSKIPKKLSPYPTGVYINFQNFFRRFSHKTRRYVQG